VLSEDVVDAGGRLTPAAKSAAAASGLVPGKGTGLGGRVTSQDLVAPATKAAPSTAAIPVGETVELPYIGIRKLIGDRMMESLNSHAQLTFNAHADVSGLLALRQKIKDSGEALGLPNITLNDMICLVVAKTLPRFPTLNGIFAKATGKFVRRTDVQLGIAIDTERGLMVPVVPNAHALTLSQLSGVIRDYASQCRSGAIDPDLLSGGTFTVTNLGAMGIESFTPVLNTPQVGIIGVCAVVQTAQPDGKGGVAFKPLMNLSLTIDHQVVDGAPAAHFLKAMVDGIQNFELAMAR
jgi:pyruvate dehydrogenase E2 component (dihydrolipoamide acetyltransferase)